jgi:chemotaxis protein CheX
MRVEYINPFLAAAIAAFDTMLGCKLIRGAPYVKNGGRPEHEVSGVIGLSGRARGTVVLSLSREAALSATAVLLDERPEEINADVTDAVGELTNIIAGSAKAQLEHLEMSVGLPTVITGKCHCVEFPKKVTPICIPFDSDWGLITVEVGLAEQPEDAGDDVKQSRLRGGGDAQGQSHHDDACRQGRPG